MGFAGLAVGAAMVSLVVSTVVQYVFTGWTAPNM